MWGGGGVIVAIAFLLFMPWLGKKVPLLFKKAKMNEKLHHYQWTGLKKTIITNGVLWTTPFNAACYLL